MSHDDTNAWSGQGWTVRRDGDQLTVRAEHALAPAEGRELGTALHHAAWTVDQQPSEGDWTHALFIALLMQAGGSVTLRLDQLEGDVFGGPSGRHHGYAAETTPEGLRVSVVANTNEQREQ